MMWGILQKTCRSESVRVTKDKTFGLWKQRTQHRARQNLLAPPKKDQGRILSRRHHDSISTTCWVQKLKWWIEGKCFSVASQRTTAKKILFCTLAISSRVCLKSAHPLPEVNTRTPLPSPLLMYCNADCRVDSRNVRPSDVNDLLHQTGW